MRLSTGIRQHPRLVGPALALSVAMALGALQASAQESQETQEREEREELPQEQELPQEEQMAEGEDLLAKAEQTGEISLFVRAVKQAGLAGELRDRGPYTVLAPTDVAFRQRFSEEELNRLLGMGQGVQADEALRQDLLSLVRAHILTGEWPSDRLGDVLGIQNVLGDRLAVSAAVGEEAGMERTAREEPEEGQEMERMEPAARTVAGTGLQVGGANVVRADIEAANGVIHLLDTLVETEPAVEEVEEEVPPVEEERTEPPPPEEDPLPPPQEEDEPPVSR